MLSGPEGSPWERRPQARVPTTCPPVGWVNPPGLFMTKADIVQAVYARLGGFSKKESADLVDLVFETMKETLGRGEKIKISGFGNFVLRDKRARQGRNPQTGSPITITERRVLNFKASQLLKHALNEGMEEASGAATPTSGTAGLAVAAVPGERHAGAGSPAVAGSAAVIGSASGAGSASVAGSGAAGSGGRGSQS